VPLCRTHGVSFSTTSRPPRRPGLREATVREHFAGRDSHRPSLHPVLSARVIAILTNRPIPTASSGTLTLARFARPIPHREHVDPLRPRAPVSTLILAVRYSTLSRSWQQASGYRSHLTTKGSGLKCEATSRRACPVFLSPALLTWGRGERAVTLLRWRGVPGG